MNTIRECEAKYGVVIDTHTADGLKVAIELRDANTPMLVLETALPAKFEDAIFEALGHLPDRPGVLDGIENLPQRFEVINADVETVKAYILANTH
jgi:threonine synthase